MGHAGLPDRVLSWARRACRQRALAVSAVGGGITHTKWRLRFEQGPGDRDQSEGDQSEVDDLVVRWADPERWGEAGREHVRREALALRLLAGSSLPVPRLLAVDLDGTEAGGPAILMSWRPGRVRLDPLEPEAVAALARTAVDVHARTVAPGHRPPRFTHRGPVLPDIPSWTERPELWRRALAIRSGEAPTTPYALVHRDLHLSNVLWSGGAVSGVIDWAETSWGPPDIDVAHVCTDLAMLHSVAAATEFRTAYVSAGGRLDPDPAAARYWVVSDLVGFLPDPAHVLPAFAADRPELTADLVRRRLEDLLADRLGR